VTRKGPSDPQAAQVAAEAARAPKRTYGGVDAGKPKRELLEDAAAAGISDRSAMASPGTRWSTASLSPL
jgi:hypothetical protein